MATHLPKYIRGSLARELILRDGHRAIHFSSQFFHLSTFFFVILIIYCVSNRFIVILMYYCRSLMLWLTIYLEYFIPFSVFDFTACLVYGQFDWHCYKLLRHIISNAPKLCLQDTTIFIKTFNLIEYDIHFMQLKEINVCIHTSKFDTSRSMALFKYKLRISN